jgi:uncharacterized protein with HEPN domain
MPRDEAVLVDILQAARDVAKLAGQTTQESFVRDKGIRYSILYPIMVVGEAVKRLSPEVREAHPEVPWKRIAGLRDIIIHQYDFLKLEEIWRVIENAFPKLIEQLELILSEVKGDQG